MDLGLGFVKLAGQIFSYLLTYRKADLHILYNVKIFGSNF